MLGFVFLYVAIRLPGFGWVGGTAVLYLDRDLNSLFGRFIKFVGDEDQARGSCPRRTGSPHDWDDIRRLRSRIYCV